MSEAPLPDTISSRDVSHHGAATWCLLLPRSLKSSVGMLYGLLRIDLVHGLFRIDFDVVVWQWEVNLSD